MFSVFNISNPRLDLMIIQPDVDKIAKTVTSKFKMNFILIYNLFAWNIYMFNIILL